jgi:hypothetical protein
VKYLLALLLAACASVPVPNVRDVAKAGHRALAAVHSVTSLASWRRSPPSTRSPQRKTRAT